MNDSSSRRTGFNTPAVVLCGLALLIFVYAVSLFLQGGFLAAAEQEYEAKVLAPEDEAVKAHLAEQQAILDEQPRWLDEEAGRVCLPIADAKARLVAKGLDSNTDVTEPGQSR